MCWIARPTRCGQGVDRLRGLPQSAASMALKGADSSAKLAACFDKIEDCLSHCFTRHCIVQDRGPCRGADSSYDACGIGGADFLRLLATADGKGKMIDVLAAVIVSNLKEEKSGVEARKRRPSRKLRPL